MEHGQAGLHGALVTGYARDRRKNLGYVICRHVMESNAKLLKGV